MAAMQEMIDITDFLDHIYVEMEDFLRFQKRCHLDEMDCTEILQQVIRQTIAERCEKLRKNPLIEQSSTFQTVQKGKQADVELLKVDIELERAEALEMNVYAQNMSMSESEFAKEALLTYLDILRSNPQLIKPKKRV